MSNFRYNQGIPYLDEVNTAVDIDDIASMFYCTAVECSLLDELD